MILLPNNCYSSELKVIPKNWKASRTSVEKNWYRRDSTIRIIEAELGRLKEGYNPIIGIHEVNSPFSQLSPDAGFIEALRRVEELIK